jgi:8-oxo-dGTP pyrophosphatase MutT (NUDIX family)
MQFRIYFNDKPLYLTDSISGPLETLQQKPSVHFASDGSEQTIKKLVTEMTQPGTTAGILYYDNIKQAFDVLKQQFILIQAAGGLVLNTRNEILLIFRRGKWDLPKGKLDEGETLEQCAVREIREETGIDVEIQSPLVITYHTYRERGEYILKESHWFLMKTHQTDFQPQIEEDIEACEWVAPYNLASYTSNIHASITDVLQAGMPYLKDRD